MSVKNYPYSFLALVKYDCNVCNFSHVFEKSELNLIFGRKYIDSKVKTEAKIEEENKKKVF